MGNNATVESFFSRSSVTVFKEEHSGKIETAKNLIIDYNEPRYLRLMKLFRDDDKKTHVKFSKKNKIDPDVQKEVNKDFYLRVWLPNKIISTKGKKIDKVVILFNGMNELENFNLYDILGGFFAENDIATILLPTPLNLNRRIQKDYNCYESLPLTKRPNGRKSAHKFPTDYAIKGDGMLFYYNFLKSKMELDYLTGKITEPGNHNDDTEDYGFYDNYFAGKATKIYLIGYSLGGLRSLAYFLNDFVSKPDIKADETEKEKWDSGESQKFKSCITINSGPGIDKTKTEGLDIKPNDWEKVVEKCKESLKIYKEDLSNKHQVLNEDKLIKLFEFVYFLEHPKTQDDSHNFEKYSDSAKLGLNLISEASDLYLAISGGQDSIVETDQIQNLIRGLKGLKNKQNKEGTEDRAHKLNQFIVGKGDHHMSKEDSEWHEFIPAIERVMLDFIYMSNTKHYKQRKIVDKLREILMTKPVLKAEIEKQHPDAFFNNELFIFIVEYLKEHGKEGEDKAFIKYYYRSKAFIPRFSEVLKKLRKK